MRPEVPAQLSGAITFPCNGKVPAVSGWSSLTESVPHNGNYGVQCGERSGVFVLDADSEEAIAWVESKGVPETFTVAAGRGVHMYFKWPFTIHNSKSGLAPKVDVRGDGGQVMGPGSIHPSGAPYRVLMIADAPAWLLAWPGLKSADRAPTEPGGYAPKPKPKHKPVTGKECERRRKLFAAWLEGQPPPCISGQGGHNRLFHVALRGMLYEALSFEDVRELLVPYNARCSALRCSHDGLPPLASHGESEPEAPRFRSCCTKGTKALSTKPVGSPPQPSSTSISRTDPAIRARRRTFVRGRVNFTALLTRLPTADRTRR